MQNAWVNVNGTIMNGSEAKVSVFDRSYLYGDSLYEVVRTYNRTPFKLKEHLVRLFKSADLCHMKLDQSLEDYEREILKSVSHFFSLPENRDNEAYVRIVVSRGVGKIGFGLSNVLTPTQFVIITQKLDIPSEALLKKGYHYKVVSRWRNPPQALDPAMKSGNYLNSLLAFLEGTDPNFISKEDQSPQDPYDDALFCDHEGFMTEGTTFNLFYVKRGIVVTSPLDVGILDGVTRRRTFEICEKLGIPYREVRYPASRLLEADEVFMTSTIKEVFPVTRIDRKPVANGKPGAITLKLRKAFFETLPS